ncbi:MAG: response regulator [Pseudomonadales bacterium]|nr:response regulator [Pseudomonadales bacterium]
MRICLLEDDLLLGRALTAWLTAAGDQVTWIRLARDFDPATATDDFDALVLDLGLADADGITVLRRLRKTGASLPVVIITARGELDQRLDGLDSSGMCTSGDQTQERWVKARCSTSWLMDLKKRGAL